MGMAELVRGGATGVCGAATGPEGALRRLPVRTEGTREVIAGRRAGTGYGRRG